VTKLALLSVAVTVTLVAGCSHAPPPAPAKVAAPECQTGPEWTCFTSGPCPTPELKGMLCAVGTVENVSSMSLGRETAALKARNFEQFYDLDEALHATIFGAIETPRALRLLEATRAPLDRVRRLALPEADRPQQTLAEHRALVEAIRSGDGEYAASAMRAHLQMVARAVERKLPEIEASQS